MYMNQHCFQGSVQFLESDDFKVLLNITAPSISQAYAVQSELVENKGRLLLQVYEKPVVPATITLPWIFIIIGIATFIVLCLATLYAIWWYCSKQYLELQNDLYSHGNVMYRSRNSMHLSSSQGGEPLLLQSEDHDNINNEDTLREELMKGKDYVEHGDQEYERVDDKRYVKQRYHSPSKKIHRELFKRDSKRKRHPSLNDPPSYNTVMQYPNESSDESDKEAGTDLANQDPELVESRQTLPCERNYQNVYQCARTSLELSLPVTHSDSDLARRHSGRVRVLPTISPTAKGLVTPVHGSNSIEQGQLSRVAKLDNFTGENSRQNISRDESNKSPFSVTADVHQGELPYDAATMQIRPKPTPLIPQPLNLEPLGADQPHPMDIPLTSFKVPSSKEQTPDSAVDELEGGYRYSIMSDRTLSMYGSSEIFDANNPDGPAYYEDRASDIDVDVPPLESDADVLSEVSLPLPSPPAYAKLPPGSPVRPFVKPTYPETPKSPITISAVQWEDPLSGGTFIAATASPTNTLDRHFQFPSQPYASNIPEQGPSQSPVSVAEPENGSFLPPPPPKVFRPPQRYSWARDDKQFGNSDYARIQKPNQQQQQQQADRQSQPSPSGGSSQGSPRTGGGKPLSGTKQLHLAVISTLCIMSLMTGVYCGMTSNDIQVHITVHAPKSFLTNNITVYFNQKKSGEVISSKSNLQAYDLADPILQSKETNLCKLSDLKCTHGCNENNGKCICKKGYRLDDNGNCVECDAPCKEGTYQELPCSHKQQKICRACTEMCEDGFYMNKPCDSVSDAVCNKRTVLPEPFPSGNVIIEKKKHAQDDTIEAPYVPSSFSGTRIFTFKRASGFHVQVAVKYIKPVITLEPVDHHGNNDLDSYHNSQEILQKYCPYPVPNHYKLLYYVHRNMTYRTRTYSSSYITPCETYEPHGRYPDQSRSPVGSIMCTEPGPVSSIFTVENEFVTPADTWVELSDSCNSSNEMCSNCTRECARFMMTFGGDCSVSGEDQDNGWSPRLHKCYTCCAQKNCSDVCDEYHNIHCHPVRCSTGNLVEFQLRPRFKDNEFLCHVTPVTNQKLMEIEYTVMHYYETLVKKSFIMYGNDVWRKTGKQSQSFGMHQSEGISLQSTFITGQMALIRPRKPFGMTATMFGIINLNISLPEYPHRPLYQYAVAVKCPEMFKLTFYIPNGDKPESDKELIVAVRDKTTTYRLNLYKPAAKVVVVTEEKSKQGHRSIESPIPDISEPPHFSVPFIASVCGCILLLLFVAAFGIAIKFGKERYNIYVKHVQKSFVTNIQETYNSVQKNKWMKGADFLHKTVKNLRDLTGATTKPFMDWAGFQTDLSQVSIGANMPLPRLPLFDDILNINVHPGTRSSKPTRVISPEQTNIQTHNMWMYKDSTAFMKNDSSNQDDKVVTMETESWNMGSYYLFFWVMMFIDIVWFFHRMLKALGVGQLLLYGYPIFVDIRDKTDETQPLTDDLSSRKLCKSGICSGFKEFTFKVLSSMFVPKVIATIFVCMVVYLISMATHHFVNRETFSYLGYYNNMEKHWREIGSAHSQFYCDYLKKIDVNAVCEPDGPIRFDDLQITACHFKRVIPKAYKRSGLINLRIIYEADEPPPPKQVS
ncbi:hypothetical protein KUTeg_011807 [Tegillarca granosa]|uniref:TNFR-Cys domain-containing protein n=1 Tax=Tegillarca granosa TaxID=220873 RepID=A0ABQ9F234_TEGGR|nr:hypothetical protein KUTeg_011807 [Tegillarca granosa]